MINARHMIFDHREEAFFFFIVGMLYFPKEFPVKAMELMIGAVSWMMILLA